MFWFWNRKKDGKPKPYVPRIFVDKLGNVELLNLDEYLESEEFKEEARKLAEMDLAGVRRRRRENGGK